MKVNDAHAVLLVSRSLPPAPAEYDRYLNATETVWTWGEWGFCPPNSDCLGTPTPSCKWVTTIMNKALTNDSGPFNQIQVVFALAPPEFPFTVYTISLHNVNDTSPVSAVNVTKDFPSHVFKGISPGTYIVKVLPFDPYFDQGSDRCLCKNENSRCLPCTPTITSDFTVGYSTPTPSCKWVTTIMNKALTNDSGPFNKIQVTFALAPPEFPFTVYTISLHNVNDTSPVSAVNVTKDENYTKRNVYYL
uniref:ILCR1 Ig-like domain-containing protein n=1 Tax=Magallana gigas TaxID=29159 RepID=K1PT74_MAGGI